MPDMDVWRGVSGLGRLRCQNLSVRDGNKLFSGKKDQERHITAPPDMDVVTTMLLTMICIVISIFVLR